MFDRKTVAPAILVLAYLLGAGPASAHGFGQRFDLPLPLWFWIAGAGATIALSFVIAAIFIRERHDEEAYPQYDLMRLGFIRWLAQPAVVIALRVLAALIFAFTIFAGFVGVQDPYNNIIVTMIWIVWWVGVAFICALIGDFWRLINPLNTIYAGVEWLFEQVTGRPRMSFDLPYPRWLGVWPAVLLFLVFAWSELVWPTNDIPRELAKATLTYAAITWVGMLLFGRAVWLRHGEAFSLAFGLFARFSPTYYRAETGEFILRPPSLGLLQKPDFGWSFVVFVLMMLATVTFDGFVETESFRATLNEAYSFSWSTRLLFELSEYGISDNVALMSIWIVIFPLGFVIIYLLASWLMNLFSRPYTEARPSLGETAAAFVLTLVPIAIAYHLAHYLQFLLTSGQFIIPLASNPLGNGWNLFGTAGYQVNIGILSPYFVWYSATAAIVIGHVLSVYIAHVVAMRLFVTRTGALVSQIPMVLLMIGYTMLSFWIMAQPIVG